MAIANRIESRLFIGIKDDRTFEGKKFLITNCYNKDFDLFNINSLISSNTEYKSAIRQHFYVFILLINEK